MRTAWTLSAFVALAGLGWGGLMLALPDAAGRALLGDTWTATQDVLLASIVFQAASALSIGPAGMLYALGQARVTFLVHTVLAPLILVGGLAGVALARAPGAAWGFALAAWAVVPLWFLRLRSAATRAVPPTAGRTAPAAVGTGRPPAP